MSSMEEMEGALLTSSSMVAPDTTTTGIETGVLNATPLPPLNYL